MSSKKEELLSLACDALQKGGVSSFSFRDLAAEAGIKSSSVHYHFKNKNDLFREIIVNFRESVSGILQELADSATSLEELLYGTISFFEQVLDDDKFCVCGMLAAEMRHLDEEAVSELKETFQQLEKWLSQNIQSYDIEMDKAVAIAKVMISSLEGSLLIDRLMQNRQCFDSLRFLIKSILVK